jgi:serine protease AprX
MSRGTMSWRTALVWFLLSLVGGTETGCRPRHTMTQSTQPYDLIASGSLDAASGASTTPLPWNAYKCCWRLWSPPRRVLYLPPAAKIDSVLAQWIADSSATKVDTLIVTYVDHVPIPRFPEPAVQQPRTSVFNTNALTQAEVAINTIVAARSAQYSADSTDLTHLGGQELERYWLTQAMRVTMPIGMVDSLAARPNVVWIQRDRTTMPPPGPLDPTGSNEVLDARGILQSDHYYNLGLTYGWVSVLDTGVRQSHVLFTGATSPFNRLGDCVDGDISCVGGNSADVTTGHGTASAAIVGANNPDSYFAPWRGVTAAKLDVFRVYRSNGADGELVVSAAIRGFETATSLLDRVIVAEMQEYSTAAAAIPAAAEGAFRAGATIIAANGNYGATTPTSMSFPSSSRTVLGVGARTIIPPHPTIASQSYGTTADGRQKPDLQAPSVTESAGSPSDDAGYILGGTSGATPYAGGSAALLRNWLTMAQGNIVDPGQIYAQLLLSGTNVGPTWPAKEGVGEIVMPADGSGLFGKIELTDCCRECSIPVQVPADIKRIQATLWWPERLVVQTSGVVNTHNDIDLHLIDPTGVERGTSAAGPGVFERTSVEVAGVTGRWHLRIDAKSFQDLPQIVFWTVGLRRQP